MKITTTFFLFIICILSSVTLFAQNRYWFGQVNQDWNEAGNWSSTPGTYTAASVPGSSDEVVIGTDATNNCNLSDNTTIASLEINTTYNFNMAGYNLTLTNNLNVTAGDVDCGSGNLVVQGDVYLAADTFDSTSDTFFIAGNFQITDAVFIHNNGTVRFTDSTELWAYGPFYNIVVDSGLTLTDDVYIENSLHLDADISGDTANVFLQNSNPTALSGNGGMYFALVTYEIGRLYWDVNPLVGETYNFPMIRLPGEAVTPTTVHIDTAGTGSNGEISALMVALPSNKTPQVAGGCDMYTAEGASNADYNLNRVWFYSPQNFETFPSVTIQINYNNADLADLLVDESRLKAQCYLQDSHRWLPITGTVDTLNNTVTFSGTYYESVFILLVDSTSPNYTTYNGNTGLTCTQAIDLDNISEDTQYEMTDTVMWFKFTATDTFMHVYVEAEEYNKFESINLYKKGCDSLLVVGDTIAEENKIHLILNQTGLVTDSIYLLRIKPTGAIPYTFKSPIVVEALGTPVAPASQSVCSDTMYTFSLNNIEAGTHGDMVEWSLFPDFRVSDTINSSADIVHSVPAGLTDTIWVRSQFSKVPPIYSASDQTYIKVNYKPNNPDPVQFVSELSDTAVDFTFDSIFAGGIGTHIEWAYDTSYTFSDTALSPATISFQTAPGAITIFWYRSIDSLSGCYSESNSGVAIVDTIPEYQPDKDTVLVVCHGGDWTYCIDNSDTNTYYILLNDKTPLDTVWGNNDTVCLNTGTIDSIVFLTVEYTDTSLEETFSIDTLLTVLAVDENDTVEFVAYDTLMFASDTFWYEAMSNHGAQIHYSIVSGGAVVDSATGRVDSVTSDFVIRATTTNNPCDTVYVDLNVTVTDIAPPVAPEPQVIFVDSTDTVTVVFDSIFPGSGGNQIEWSENEDFSSSTVVYGMTTINIDVPVESEKNIWIRTRHNETGKVSKKTFTSAKVLYNVLSAGLLDKSKWQIDTLNDRYSEFGYLLPYPGQNPSFMEVFALNYKWNWWDADSAGSPRYCPNHVNFDVVNNREIFNYGNLDGNNPIDGIGGEVVFSNGLATLTATRLPIGIDSIYTCSEVPNNVDTFRYSSGMILCKDGVNFAEPGMLEMRCKLPFQDLIWPAFWAIPGGVEFDFFDNSAGPEVLKTIFMDKRYDEDTIISCSANVAINPSCNLSDDWHTYTYVWSDEEVVAFLDGKEYWSFNRQIPGKPDIPSDTTDIWASFLISLQAPYYVSGIQYKMHIDYIRYYSPKNSSLCDISKSSMQNLFGCYPLTYEDLPATLSNNIILPVTPRGYSAKIGPQKMSLIRENNISYIFYQSETSVPFIAYNQNGIWKEEVLFILPAASTGSYPSVNISGELTPVNSDLVYCKGGWFGSNDLIELTRLWGHYWKAKIIHTTNGVNEINIDTHGNVFFRGNDNNLYQYLKPTSSIKKLTITNNVAGGLKVHSNGRLAIYHDVDYKLRQFWLGYGESLISNDTILTNETAIDEMHNRYYFIGKDHGVYFYDFGRCVVGICPDGLPSITKLGNGSKERRHYSDSCSLTNNAQSNLTISFDGNTIYYRALDQRIWYYYNDRESSLVSEKNWYNTLLRGSASNTAGSILIENKPFGFIYHAGFGRLHQIIYDIADRPIEDCYESPHTDIYGYKSNLEVEKINLVDTTSDDESQMHVLLYPNPSNDMFSFKLSGAKDTWIQLSITDLSGKLCYSSSNWELVGDYYRLQWDASGYSFGYYIFNITTGNGQHVYGKLIKL